jgi:RHS repeat-associated protein
MHHTRCAVLTLAAVSAAFASDSQVLEVYDNGLTAYRYTSGSPVQDVRPQHFHRGVHIDGSIREAPLFEWAAAGNPWSEEWNEKNRLGSVRLDVGAYSTTDIDMALPAPGFSWVVGRTYNSRQLDGASHHDSDSYQGWNWFQTSQPEIVYLDSDGDPEDLELDDMIYLIYGADRFLEFRRAAVGEGVSDDTFRGVNGTAGAVQYIAGTPDLYVYHDQNGMEVTFFGGDTSTDADWQLWKMEDPAGNVAYVGSLTASTAISTGYESSGAIKLAYDTEGRRYDYSYNTFGGTTRLESVIASVNSGSWVEVQRVEYDYYDATQACGTYGPQQGEAGDLKRVRVTTPLSQASTNLVETTYYRYWTSAAYEPDPEESCYNPGDAHTLKMVVGPEGVRKFDYTDSTFDGDFETASDADLKPYSDAYFTYHDTTLEIATAVFDGECGCTGGVNGTHAFTYETDDDYTDGSGYDIDGSSHAQWAYRTVIDPPNLVHSGYQVDVAWTTQYFDEVGQPLSYLRSVVDPATDEPTNTYWFSHVFRDATGCITEIGSASHTNVSGAGDYDHDDGSSPDGSFSLDSGNEGLVYQFARAGSGDYTGFATSQTYTDWYASGDPEYLLWSRTFFVDGTNGYHKKTVGDFDVVRPLIDDSSVYATFETSVGTNAQTTSFDYTFHEAIVLHKVKTTEPTVSTGYAPTNVYSYEWYNDEGDLVWSQDPLGAVTYHEHISGQLSRLVEDADTSVLDGESIANPYDGGDTDFVETSGTLHRQTEWVYDEQGRVTDTTLPSGRLVADYYTVLLDRRSVLLEIPRVTTGGSTTYYGPAEYSVYNHVGETEAVATIAVYPGSTTTGLDSWIDETDSDVILAFSLGGGSTLASLTTTTYSNNGRKLTDEYRFHEIPASMSAALDTEYERTKYEFNHMGLVDNTTDPTGTQVYRKYTSHGQMFSQGVQAEDRTTGPPSNDIVWVSSGGHGGAQNNTYHPGQGGGEDGGGTGGGGSGVTDWSCWSLVLNPVSTTLALNPRNQPVLIASAGGPVYLCKYDNLGRVLAVGVYDAIDNGLGSGVWRTTDPMSYDTKRLALYEAFYDARGNRYKVTRHKIDPSDGSADDSLDLFAWVDGLGREIKRDNDQLTKRTYDRLGRVTREFVLAKDNDASYEDADDVSGDTVLEDTSWAYDLMDNVLLTARVDRFHNGTTSGALDSNADGDDLMITAANLSGRPQITVNWYDSLDRLSNTGVYGTNGGSDLDRDGLSVPSRPTTGVLLASYAYDDAGRRSEMTDPLGADTRWTFDDAGRATQVIRNYVDGTAGGGAQDDEDLVTEFEYVVGTLDGSTPVYGTGQLNKIKAYQNGATTQVTTYTYGITSGSDITAGHLLREATYPDSSGAPDAVSYTYNGALLPATITDQDENVTEVFYDFGTRKETSRTFTRATGSNLDPRIDSIYREYDPLGRLETVTQYDGGSIADEVKFTYDGWGNLEQFDQDLNSAVNADALSLQYTYSKKTGGRNALVLSSLTYPGGAVVSHDQGDMTDINRTNSYYAARTDRVRVNTGSGAVTIAKYDFLGANRVVGTTHPFTGGDVHSRQYGSTSGSYPDLDQFNRVTTSRWSKVRSSGSPVDWYKEMLTHDNNSNITRTEHGFFDRLDALFTVDDLGRITDVEVGDYSGGSISNDRFGEVWDLTQLGNWAHHSLDLSGDGDYADANEFVDQRTFNTVNEMTDRDLDTDGDTQHDDANYDLVYDEMGNLTDDGESYEFIYDIRGQLTKVTDRATPANDIAVFRYNGLGYLISKQFDYDANGTLDSDEWRHFVYDDQWRVIETYRGDTAGDPTDEAEDDPKERYVYHAAGQDGVGSYIDDLVLRDRDAVQPGSNTDPADTWSWLSDGTLEERVFLCQSWRADVVLVLDDAGDVAQRAWYSPYGVPTGCDGADLNADGTIDTSDSTILTGWITGSDPRGDWNLDGSYNSQDAIAYGNDVAAAMTFDGRGHLSSDDLDVQNGYAGYRWDAEAGKYHVRNRVYDPYSGRWSGRDPIGYTYDDTNLYQYAVSSPVDLLDAMGLCGTCVPQTAQPEQPEKKDEKKKKPTRAPALPGELKPLPGERESGNPGGRDNERDNLKDEHPDFDRTVEDIQDLAEGVNKRPDKQAKSVLMKCFTIIWRRWGDPQPTEPIDSIDDQLPGESDDAYKKRQEVIRKRQEKS